MKIPDSLRERIELYRSTGRIRARAGELFTDLSWFYIFEGLGVEPADYDPLADVVTTATASRNSLDDGRCDGRTRKDCADPRQPLCRRDPPPR